jgi:ABC-2 type transport system ATP-binding protein
VNILIAENLTKSYSGNIALNNLNLEIKQGEIFGLLGPNGAGKSTFIRLINRIIFPDKGTISIAGEPLHEKHVLALGYLPEERGLYKKMKVGENLLYFARLRGIEKSEAEKLAKSKLSDFNALEWWDKKVEELSKGMQQKVQFIATILHNPKLVILDEPFSGFDPLNADLIKSEILKLKAQGASIILSTHRMESVEELCDSIGLIHRANLVLQGRTSEIKNQFRNHIFSVQFKGTLNASSSFEILEQTQGNVFNKALLKIKEGISNNQALNELIAQVEVIAFAEKLPDMNQIFIQTINRQNA